MNENCFEAKLRGAKKWTAVNRQNVSGSLFGEKMVLLAKYCEKKYLQDEN